MSKTTGKSKKFRSRIVGEIIKGLPYFRVDNLLVVEKNKKYLKILLSRLSKKGAAVSLKKGMYVSKDYLENIEKKGKMSEYLEFIANILCEPSYLSIEYVLGENNILTESSNSFTLITRKKTKKFFNKLGLFDYHHIKGGLFGGFKIYKHNDFIIKKASPAKALFDFLYLRRNILPDKKAVEELRLNLGGFGKKDLSEFKKYIKLENSGKMNKISSQLAFNYGRSKNNN